MNITDVRVFPVDEDKLKAYVTITLDHCFVIRDLKVIHGATGLFVAMPAKRRKDGTYKDIAHPLNADTRLQMERAILDEYARATWHPAPAGRGRRGRRRGRRTRARGRGGAGGVRGARGGRLPGPGARDGSGAEASLRGLPGLWGRPMQPRDFKVFSGSSNPALAQRICEHLKRPLGKAQVGVSRMERSRSRSARTCVGRTSSSSSPPARRPTIT